MSSTPKSSSNERHVRNYGSFQDSLKHFVKDDSDGFRKNPTPGKASEIIQSLNKKNSDLRTKPFDSWKNDHSWRNSSGPLKSTGCTPKSDRSKNIKAVLEPAKNCIEKGCKDNVSKFYDVSLPKDDTSSKAVKSEQLTTWEHPSDSSDQPFDNIEADCSSDPRLFKKEKDKSNKRKSNLNRSTVAEAVLYDSDQHIRPRRRLPGSDSGSDMVTDSQDNPDSYPSHSSVVKFKSSSLKEKSTSDTSDQPLQYRKTSFPSVSPEKNRDPKLPTKFPVNSGQLSKTVRRLEALSSQESSDVSKRSWERGVPWANRRKANLNSRVHCDEDKMGDSSDSKVSNEMKGIQPGKWSEETETDSLELENELSKYKLHNMKLFNKTNKLIENEQDNQVYQSCPRKKSLDSELTGFIRKGGGKGRFNMQSEPQGILKRKCSFDYGETEHHGILKLSGSEENDKVESQGILKRRSMSGPDMTATDPKPILKKLSSSEDLEPSILRPILKKKVCTDDESEDKPKPILKMKQKSLEELESLDTTMRSILKKRFEGSDERLDFHSDCDKPKSILKSKSHDGSPTQTPDKFDASHLMIISSDSNEDNQQPSAETKPCHVQKTSVSEKSSTSINSNSSNVLFKSPSVVSSLKSDVKEKNAPLAPAEDPVLRVMNDTAPPKLCSGEHKVPVEEPEEIDPSMLPLAKRIAFFNQSLEEKVERTLPILSERKKRSKLRFSTQPVTSVELALASHFSNPALRTDNKFLTNVCPKSSEVFAQSDGPPVSVILSTPFKDGKKDESLLSSTAEKSTVSSSDSIPENNLPRTHCNMNKPEVNSDAESIPHTPGSSGILSRLDALRKSGEMCWRKRIDKHVLPVPDGNSSISQRLESLKHNGEIEWQKRLDDMRGRNETLTGSHESLAVDRNIERKRRPRSQRPSSLKERISIIQSHEDDWKKRVGEKDVTNFTVAGKMEKAGCIASPVVDQKFEFKSSLKDRGRKVPALKIIKSSEVSCVTPDDPNSKSTPETPDADNVVHQEIEIPRVDDESFNSFFRVEISSESRLSQIDLDLDSIAFHSDNLLSSKKCIKFHQRRTATSKNPLKALAARSDIRQSYIESRPTEPSTPTSAKENPEKPVFTIEDIKQQGERIRTSGAQFSNKNNEYLPFKDLMLIQIKGRRHVQVRLVEPSVQSVNSGDVYLLVTPTKLFYWVGKFSNVQEQNKGLQIAKDIVKYRDLGVKTESHVKVEEGSTCRHTAAFWQLLGGDGNSKALEAAAPEEDEEYELSVTETNMVYELQDGTLVPLEKYWGYIPKKVMLDDSKILVFDFGSELYMWMGRRATSSKRKACLVLFRQLWEQEFDYSTCDFNPMNCCAKSDFYGSRGTKRPEWTLLAKISSHMETILFKEKFDDWPHSGRMPVDAGKDKRDKEYKDVKLNMDLVPYDAKLMLDNSRTNSSTNLRLDASTCVGRGVCYYDEEFHRYHEVETLEVSVMTLKDKELTNEPVEEFGQFYVRNSYVCRWTLQINQRARTLQGGLSNRFSVGKKFCCFFLWHGSQASDSTRGMTAKALADLQTEHHRQLLIEQGEEPPAFLNMFDGKMVIRYGSLEAKSASDIMMFRVAGVHINETHLVQVEAEEKSLRSKTCYVVVDSKRRTLYVWHGAVATGNNRTMASKGAESLVLSLKLKVKCSEVNEGEEPSAFWTCLHSDGKRKEYHSLLDRKEAVIATPRLFHLTGVTGKLQSDEILCSYDDTKQILTFPFSQKTLYSASQPALFLLDNHSEFWIWQGVYVQSSESYHDQSDLQRRWDAVRRVGLVTALEYARLKDSDNLPDTAVVMAGSEPLEFTNLFPEWDMMVPGLQKSLPEGCRSPTSTNPDVISASEVLSQLTCVNYSLKELTSQPLPEGVVSSMLEKYLKDEDFHETFGIHKGEFYKLPYWKQLKKKKEVGLFV